ncbi:MAG: nuclear transport factor 2 family protein, partial [Sphingobacteriales bacterium]
AMIDADENMLKSLTSDKLVYGHSLGAVEDKTAFVQNIVNGNSDFVTIDITDQTLTISGNAAIVRHKLYAKTNDKGKPGEVRLVIMQVWQRTKKDGEWKLLARQAVRPPQQ